MTPQRLDVSEIFFFIGTGAVVMMIGALLVCKAMCVFRKIDGMKDDRPWDCKVSSVFEAKMELISVGVICAVFVLFKIYEMIWLLVNGIQNPAMILMFCLECGCLIYFHRRSSILNNHADYLERNKTLCRIVQPVEAG